MMFGAVLHVELMWDFSFSVLGHGIITDGIGPRPLWGKANAVVTATLLSPHIVVCDSNKS